MNADNEAVAWQARHTKRDGSWGVWLPCSQETFNCWSNNVAFSVEVRALYAAPASPSAAVDADAILASGVHDCAVTGKDGTNPPISHYVRGDTMATGVAKTEVVNRIVALAASPIAADYWVLIDADELIVGGVPVSRGESAKAVLSASAKDGERIALLTSPSAAVVPEGLIAKLRDRYKPSVIPPCRVCGGELSIGSIGGGEPTRWACDDMEHDPDRPGLLRQKEGRRSADDHYSKSVWVDRRQGGDYEVIELLDIITGATP